MSAHRFCTWPDECPACDARASRAEDRRAERDTEREDWPDAALWNATPEYGRMLSRGGW